MRRWGRRRDWCLPHPSPPAYRPYPLPQAVEGFRRLFLLGSRYGLAVPHPFTGEGGPGRGRERGAANASLQSAKSIENSRNASLAMSTT
jgi:hypothetical protein